MQNRQDQRPDLLGKVANRILWPAGIAGLLIFISVAWPQSSAAEAPYDLTEEFLASFERLEEDQIDLCSLVLDISVRAGQDLGFPALERGPGEVLIKTMSEGLSPLIKDRSSPEDLISTMNQYLFSSQGLMVDRSRLFESSLDSLLFPLVLQDKSGHCLSLSLIYLILAQKLDLPLYGVIVPGHFFVRYDDGKFRKNIETTQNGASQKDENYKWEYLKGGQDPVSLMNLTKKQVLAVYLSNVANHYKLKGDPQKALAIFAIVERILPGWPSLYTNMGNAHERLGRIGEAVHFYQKALALDPKLGEAYYNLGLIHFLYTRRLDLAKRYGETARTLGCRFHPEYKSFLDASR